MTRAEAKLCDAAERCWRWGSKPAGYATAERKYGFWRRRMNRAAFDVWRERAGKPKAGRKRP
jgi:hypothetical protein